ncbi:hypothetical protein NLM24_29835 [Nocardia zapadnayensis]|nr:hypothetical protein [Nocardia zapadnayensis]MCX0274824.1 hypothetical protein [Nocardia zapadnayensis]
MTNELRRAGEESAESGATATARVATLVRVRTGGRREFRGHGYQRARPSHDNPHSPATELLNRNLHTGAENDRRPSHLHRENAARKSMDEIVAISTLFPRLGSAAGAERTDTADVSMVVRVAGTGTAVTAMPGAVTVDAGPAAVAPDARARPTAPDKGSGRISTTQVTNRIDITKSTHLSLTPQIRSIVT